MKKLKWNLGIWFIRIGYKIRDPKGRFIVDLKPYSFRVILGKLFLRFGFSIRGEVPRKLYKWNDKY